MSEIVVAYARPDEDAAALVIGKLEKLGFKVTPSLASGRPGRGRRAASAAPTVVLWSHSMEATRSGAPSGKALLARLDSAQPSPLLKAKAVDLRQWRGRDDHRGWRSLLASVQAPVVTAKPVKASKTAAKAVAAPVVAAEEPKKKGGTLGAIIGWTIAGLVVAAGGAAAVLFLL